jgi:hypothetical protein
VGHTDRVLTEQLALEDEGPGVRGRGRVCPQRREDYRGQGRHDRRPSWAAWSIEAETQFDLFKFRDAPIFERLYFSRTFSEGQNPLKDQNPLKETNK